MPPRHRVHFDLLSPPYQLLALVFKHKGVGKKRAHRKRTRRPVEETPFDLPADHMHASWLLYSITYTLLLKVLQHTRSAASLGAATPPSRLVAHAGPRCKPCCYPSIALGAAAPPRHLLYMRMRAWHHDLSASLACLTARTIMLSSASKSGRSCGSCARHDSMAPRTAVGVSAGNSGMRCVLAK